MYNVRKISHYVVLCFYLFVLEMSQNHFTPLTVMWKVAILIFYLLCMYI